MRENGARTAVVVAVHGAGGGGWEWGIWARALARRGFEVIAPDLMPGAHGIEKTSFMDYRSQVMDWCAGARASVVLIGASLGGLLALSAAQRVKPVARVLARLDAPRDARRRRRRAAFRASPLARRIGRGTQRGARRDRGRAAALP